MTEKDFVIPKVVFEPGFSLDLAYPVNEKATTPFEEKWDELTDWIPEIQEEWESKEKRVLEITVNLLSKGFRRRELSAALILSPLPSMSYPLVINVSTFLKSSKDQKPRFYFFSTVYHELLHRYLNEGFSVDVLSSSPLLRKYIDRREPRAVISHLHLFAVQKWVYLNIGKEEELRKIVQWNSEADDLAYARAWTIVNELDGLEAYIKELQVRGTKSKEIAKQSRVRADL